MTELPALPSQTLCRRLGIAHPIILAPMGGGAGTPELVAAVANAGGLGSLGAPYLTPDQIGRESPRSGVAPKDPSRSTSSPAAGCPLLAKSSTRRQ